MHSFSSFLFLFFFFFTDFSLNMSLQLSELVLRPGPGRSGKPVNVRANFFEITAFGTQNIHHYDVQIDPPDTPVPILRKVWKAFEDTQGQGTFINHKVIFDGRKNVFSPKPLDLGEAHAKNYTVNILYSLF